MQTNTASQTFFQSFNPFIAQQRVEGRYFYSLEIDVEQMIGTDFSADVQVRMHQIINLLGGADK
jgi:hypothetical protein